MISNSSSADLVNVMVQLSQAQTVYQAALQSGVQDHEPLAFELHIGLKIPAALPC